MYKHMHKCMQDQEPNLLRQTIDKHIIPVTNNLTIYTELRRFHKTNQKANIIKIFNKE